jgi:hypothetical protein
MAMHITPQLRRHLLVQNGLFVVLLVILAAVLAHLALEFRLEKDVTRNARNSLSAMTLDTLRQMNGPIRITAYALRQDSSGSDIHRQIEERLNPYRKAHPQLQLELVDPREHPRRVAAAGLRSPNALIVEYLSRSEQLPLAEFDEQNFANLLMRLLRGADTRVYVIEGHGERRIDGPANHDLGDFGRQLAGKGFRPLSLNTGIVQEIPDDAGVIVLTHPQTNWQPAEIDKLMRYLERGGNLLWLIDTEPLRGLQPVAEKLGLVLTPGVIIDPAMPPRSGPPVYALAAAYARHPTVGSLRFNTLFPQARQVGADDSLGWRVTPLIDVAPRGWVEMSKLTATPSFDKTSDLPGPVNIANAFERSVNDRAQRVVVIGNGHFLSNTFLGNAGNLALGIGLLNWLSGNDRLVTIDSRNVAHEPLTLSPLRLYATAALLFILLPLGFAITGFVRWWRLRHAA